MKLRLCFITLLLCLLMLSMSNVFAKCSDIEGHWAQTQIQELLDNGIVEGYADGNFKPNKYITRAELVTAINKAFDFNKPAKINFKDVKPNNPYYKNIAIAVGAGYIKGYSNGTFKPNSFVTRQELAEILAKVFNLEVTGDLSFVNKLKDKRFIKKVYMPYVNAVLEKGYMNTYNNNLFRPRTKITRADAVVFIHNIIEDLAKKSIVSISLTNGTININFDNEVNGLKIEDFLIVSKLNDTEYSLKDLKFDSSNNSFSFTPIENSDNDQVLEVTVSAASPSDVIEGSATAKVTIPKKTTAPTSSETTPTNSETTTPTIPSGFYFAISGGSPDTTNRAPSTPVISKTPAGGTVSINDDVTITASSADPDGDAITYVWEGRTAETNKYSAGKHIVTAKAVDEHGLESTPAAIVFFALDTLNGSGGVMLTGPESRIYENGIQGATITGYTFKVPSVSGHGGNDYAWVKGLNINTKKWDNLQYATTSNGIIFTNVLNSGVYSRLEFFYYASHCMYGKSNITYTVEFAFDGNSTEQKPEAKDVSLSLAASKQLEGRYTYFDANGDLEDVSTFKWYRSDDAAGTNKTAISGAASDTYTLVSEDSGKYISFEVTPIAKTGGDGTLTGNAAESSELFVTESAPVALNVGIQGIAKEGQTLNGIYTYADIDGDNEGTSTFKWYRADDAAGTNKAAITGATSTSYTITTDDLNKYLSFEVTPIAQSGTANGITVESTVFGIVESAPIAKNVIIGGWNSLESTLTGYYNYYDANGDNEDTSIYKWYRSDKADGALTQISTSLYYEITPADTNKYLTFEVTPIAKTGTTTGNPQKSESWFIAKVVPNVEDITISGTAKVGEKLTGNYTFIDDNGDLEAASIFRWLRYDPSTYVITEIPGTNTKEYTLTADDLGKYIWFEVLPVSQSGSKATTGGTPYSNNSGQIAPGEAAPTASSVNISGSLKVGETLTGSYTYSDINGDAEGISTFKWYRADDAAGTNKAAILGATLNTYVLVADDLNKYISFEVTPSAASGLTPGSAVESSLTGSIGPAQSAPTASGITITGTLEVGVTLTGSYSYADADGDNEGTSTFKWYRSDDASGTNKTTIAGATSSTYTLVTDDHGKFISFEVTPVAQSGLSPGTSVESSILGAITIQPQ